MDYTKNRVWNHVLAKGFIIMGILRDRDRMVVGFTNTCAISSYHR
jgi:hypothetical protein